jgi:predicted MFS family arabinose efflux permease
LLLPFQTLAVVSQGLFSSLYGGVGSGLGAMQRLTACYCCLVQGLFSSLYAGVGSGLGALLGGVLMQQLGGQALFFICALVVLAGWLVGQAVELLLVRRDAKSKV